MTDLFTDTAGWEPTDCWGCDAVCRWEPNGTVLGILVIKHEEKCPRRGWTKARNN